MNVTDIILNLAAVYTIGVALIMQTKNVISSIIFKVIPFFLGLACLYAAWVLPS
jgi:hypothetical protein